MARFWGVSGDFAHRYYNDLVVTMVDVENIYKRTLTNYIVVAGEDLGVAPPYQIEMGAVGLQDMRLSLPPPGGARGEVSEPVYEDEIKLRRVLNDISAESQRAVVDEFLDKLYDLAGVTRSPPR